MLERELMILLEEQPTLTDLHSLISKVPAFPINTHDLVELASKYRFPKTVIDFYKAFKPDQVFQDRDDLATKTESLEILHHETAPMEEMRASED